MAGSTTYPTSVDNKTQLTDGVDIIQADDVNDSYVPIDAIETFIGASGSVQAKNTDILAFLEAITTDMRLKWIDVNTIQVSSGRIYCKNAAGTIRVLRKNTTTVNVTFTDRDTGSRALNTRYYVWANADATSSTVTFKISTSATAPTGVSVFGLVGHFATNNVGVGEIIQKSVSSVAGLKIVQRVITYDQTARSISYSTGIPQDGTKPQFSEGARYTQLDTPFAAQSVNNRLLITVVIAGDEVGGNGSYKVAALFRDGTSNPDAIATGASGRADGNGASSRQQVNFKHDMAVPTVNPTVFQVNVGNASGTGTAYVNLMADGTTHWGNTWGSIVIIEEYVP